MMKQNILIIGNGLAGMQAAISAKKSGAECSMISMVYAVRSHSVAAQGGMNAALGNVDSKDSWEEHAFDTVKGSDYLADQRAVEILTKQAIPAVYELERYGVPFSRIDDGRIAQRPFGGAGSARTCYSEDRTGHNLLHGLYQQCLRHKVKFLNERMVIDLVMKNDMCIGVVALNFLTGTLETIEASTVIIATGGAGRIYGHSTNALINSGLGIYQAYKAGVAMKDMEFIQFHPTTLYGTNILITEGARGEGGYLLNKNDERFMKKYAPKQMELAPRDIVARAITTEILEGRGVENSYVYLDLRHLGAEKINERLPGIREIGIRFADVDIIDEKMPIQPGQHYTMGGIDCNVHCETSVKNIYAAGECACVSVHGSNRLGGNSLLDTIVFGKIAGERAAQFYTQNTIEGDDQVLQKALKQQEEYIEFFSDPAKHERAGTLRKELRGMMMKKVGVFRHEKDLKEAIVKIKELKARCQHIGVTSPNKVFNLELISALEVEGMIETALIITEGALQRKESRGSHSRTDFPKRDDVNFLNHTLASYTDSGPVFSSSEVDCSRWEPKERSY